MKNIVFLIAFPFILLLASCSKQDATNNATNDLANLQKTVAKDFSSNIALPLYADLQTASADLQNNLQQLEANPTDANLTASRQSWKNMRAIWEMSEGFLFGPVEDNEYDPQSDTWPTDYQQINSLLADSTNHNLGISDIQTLDYSLRGYHPLEYMLWGVSGNKKAADLTLREKKYIKTLAADLNNICTSLYSDWTNGFADQVSNAGTANSIAYPKYIDLFTVMNNGLADICNEVGKSDQASGKMYEPFSALDSSIVESPFSENSMTDFRNNIHGAYNVYIGKYKDQKTGMSDLVQLLNKDLDNRIKQKFQAAINAFSTVNMSFEKAIFTQRVQLQNIINAIGETRDILDNELKPFLVQNVKN